MFQTIVFILIGSAGVLGTPIDSRVVNGSDAQIQEFPFVVSLRVSGNHNCGGSLLNHQFVLTAAHCVSGYAVSMLSVQYGLTKIVSGLNASNTVNVAVKIPHENYTPGHGYYNDVAVLKLEKSLVFSDTVQAVRLPPANNATPENAPANLTGWGYEASGGSVQTNLQMVGLKVYSDEECEEIHYFTGPTNRTYNICGGVPEGGKGQCSGDSGGPLLIGDVIVGTVSWSVKPCTIKPYPGVYSKVSTQVDWILQKILENS